MRGNQAVGRTTEKKWCDRFELIAYLYFETKFGNSVQNWFKKILTIPNCLTRMGRYILKNMNPF